MIMQEFLDKYGKTVEVKAGQLARAYPGIEAEDIQQEIYLEMLKPHRLRDAELVPEYVERQAYLAGKTYCEKERYDYMFHSAQYVYTPREIRALFAEAFFDRDIWQKAPTKETSPDIQAGGVVISLWDLDQAYETLTASEQIAIQKKCDMKETLIGGEQDRYERAIDKVTRYLNRGIAMKDYSGPEQHEGPGSRQAMSNADAQYITEG